MPENQRPDDSTAQPIQAADAPREGLARIRRRPNIPAFLGTGALIGAIVGVLFSQTSGNGNYSSGQATAYVAVFFALLGLVIATVAIVILDKRADRH